MDIERALVSKIVFTGQFETAISRNIQSDMFADDECRRIYDWLMWFVKEFGHAPSLEAAKHDNPDFAWLQIDDTLEWVIQRFSVLVKRRMADEMLLELGEACNDPERSENIENEFLEVARRLTLAVPTAAVEYFKRDMGKRHDQYMKDKAEGKPPGIPTGYPTIDRLTGGIQRHELATVLAFTSVGKSTFLRSLAFNFWIAQKTPLYISLEMESRVILRILDSMATGMDYQKLKQLQLEDRDLLKWKSYIARVQAKPCDIPVIDSQHRITPDQVFAQMVRYQPDVCIVDYVGLMKSSNISRGVKKYQQITDITQDLKHIARTLKIPIVMAAQTNRGGSKDGGELDNVADSISISQDSDLVFGLHQDEDMEREGRMEIRVQKNRDGKRGKFEAIWRHETQEFREPDANSFMRAKANVFIQKAKENGNQPHAQHPVAA